MIVLGILYAIMLGVPVKIGFDLDILSYLVVEGEILMDTINCVGGQGVSGV